MSASEPNRPEFPSSREELAVAPTQAFHPDEPSSQLATLLDGYLAELQAGRRPDRRKLLADHPDLAVQLEQCLSGIEFIHQASAVRPASEPLGQLGDFRIIREVGRGGMGVVYEAEQVTLKRRVALKVLRYGAAADSEAMQRFQREAETVATLHHTNIVPIFAIGCENGVNYYAMQFIEGRSLACSDRIYAVVGPDKSGHYELANWGLQAAEALAHAHHRGVIHRDIKPSNLILDPDGRIWLTDFGLAKRIDDVSLSMAGAILGTPRYMSPEQAAAAKQPVDHRTDIYSLGATLYELATGRPLFEGDSPHLVITQILTTEPPAPRVLCPGLHRDFETIILKCLAKEPSQRYQTAQALADDLRAFVEGRAIKARRSTLVEQAARWFKQQKRSVGIAAAAVAATIFVVVGSLIAWQMHGQAKLGYVTLNTPREGDQRAEVAEVLSLNDEPVGSPFTLPTKEPLALPEGAYRLRLTAPGKVSQTYLFDVAAGSQQTHEVGLVNETVGYPISLRSPVGVELSGTALAAGRRELPAASAVPLTPSEPRLFVGPQDQSKPTLRCYSIRSQPQQQTVQEGSSINVVRSTEPQPLWEANWSLDAPDIISFVKLPADREAWKVLPAQWDVAAWQQMLSWFDPWWFRNGAPPQIVSPVRDLNGDGVEDVIWAAPRQLNPFSTNFGAGPLTPKAAVLVAASGKDGKPLWWFRPQDAQGNASRLLSPPVACGSLLVMALRSTGTGEVWVESVDALSGESRWRSERISVVPQSSVWISPLTTSGGVSEVFVVGGTRLLVLDLQTGTPRPGFRSPSTSGTDNSNQQLLRENEPILDTRFGDLDGDGTNEVVLTVMSSDRGIQDMAFSVTQNKMLWEVPSSFEVGAWHQNESRHSWPLMADLDGDGQPEVILPGIRESGSNVSDGCRVLNGKTGEPRWTRRIPRRAGFSHWKPEQITVGPDLDGDGQAELIMASIRSEFVPRLARQAASHHYEERMLYVDCFSGRDGRSLWWQRVPLGLTEYAAMTGEIGEMLWWGRTNEISRNALASGSKSDKPDASAFRLMSDASIDGVRLIIPVHRVPDTQQDGGTHSIYVLNAETGRIEHQADDMAFPQLVDWNNDGLDDLAVFVPDDPERFEQRHHYPVEASGKFVVLRGSPPEAFRRLDRWNEEQDFDGDGIAELSQRMGGRGVDYSVQIASGADGRVIGQWKTEWPETPRSFTVGELHSFAPPLGDFDGDGLADLLVTRELRFWDIESDAAEVVKTGTVPLLIQAISGKSGRRIWGGPRLSLPDEFRPTSADHRKALDEVHNNSVNPTTIMAVDLDRDGSPELLQTLRLFGQRFPEPRGPAPIERQQLQLALIDGRRGTLLWSEPCTELLGDGAERLTSVAQLLLDASADLNGDGTLDVLLLTPTSNPDGSTVGNLQAYSGRDGKRLWKPDTRPWAWFNSYTNAGPLPQIGDLDGDGKPELVLLESKQPMVVKVLSGDTGETRWTWNGALPPNYPDPSMVICRMGTLARPDAESNVEVKDRTGKSAHPTRGVAVTINEKGNQWELVLLDHAGRVVERMPYHSSQFWSHDLDGDGLEELLRPGSNKLTASRGLHDTLWEWSPPARFGYAFVSRFDRAADGRVYVSVSGDDSLTLLDGPTGKPLGRTWKSTNTKLHENGRFVDMNHAHLAAPFENSRLLSRVGDGPVMLNHVVSRAVLPTDDDGRYRRGSVAESSPVAPRPERRTGSDSQSSAREAKSPVSSALLSRSDRTTLSDPRLVRQLPWAPSQAEWAAGKAEMLKQVGLAVSLAFAVVLIPFWLIRAGVRRKELGWWRGALIVAGAAVFATSLAMFRFAPPGAVWRDVPWALPIAIGVAALPGLVWTATLLRYLLAGEWRRLSWLLGGSLFAAAAMATLILSLTASQKPPEQHYSWHAWWFILLFGAHAVGALLVLWYVLSPGVRGLWRFSKRRFARHA